MYICSNVYLLKLEECVKLKKLCKRDVNTFKLKLNHIVILKFSSFGLESKPTHQEMYCYPNPCVSDLWQCDLSLNSHSGIYGL